MIDYAEIADVKAFARQPDALPDDGWQLLVSSASLLFDIICEVDTDFFARPPNPQYYAGNDSENLPIGALTESRTVHSVAIENDAYPVPRYQVIVASIDEETFTGLLALDGGKWNAPHRVIVRADFAPMGEPAISPDVKQAVIEMAIHIWRKGDPSFTSISSAENAILLDELPPTARATAQKYKEMFSNRCLFA